MARVRLGELLVKAGMISQEQLDEVLGRQSKDGRRLGTMLIDSGLVTETQVTQILSQQLSVPWVSLYHIDFSRQLLNLVRQEIAEKYCLVPIFVRRVRGVGECLYIAMDDPSNESAQNEVSTYSGLPVRAMIAPPSDIRNAIRVYYGGEPAELDDGAHEDEQASPADPSSPPPPDSDSAPTSGRDSAVEAMVAAAKSEPSEPPPSVVPAREAAMPPPAKGGAARMLELTLLDGTTVRLPAQSKKEAAAEPPESGDAPAAADGDQLTARDLVAALRAVSHGADATEILGEDARWEKMFAALLSLLLKKHLIADWEFVEEYKNI